MEFENTAGGKIPALSTLDALTPPDGRYHLQTEILSPYLSEAALIKARVEVEARYLIVLSETRNTDGTPANIVRALQPEERELLLKLGPSLTGEQVARIKQIEDTTRHDVKAMERGLREILSGTSLKDIAEAERVHIGLTSEDINNLANRLMLTRAREDVMVPTANAVVDRLVGLANEHKATPMLARTHGQPAIPTTLGKEMANFAVRLQRQIRLLQDVQLTGKLNGAVGNYNALALAFPNVDWVAFSERFINELRLEPNLFTTQINSFDDIIQTLQAFQRVNGVILDIDLDMWRYISDGWFVQQVKAGEVGSSTMPQKVNPINFENSEGNAEVATGLLETMSRTLATSRLQRDLSNSTIIRNLGPALAYCLISYRSILEGLDRVRPNLTALNQAIDQDYSILTEGVQTLLRRDRVSDPYSMIANLTRGQHITSQQWQEWVSNLPAEIDGQTKAQLLELTPERYIGEAVRLTDMAIEEVQRLRN